MNRLLKCKIEILFGFLVILLFFIDGTPFVFGDGYGYFHTAKVLVKEEQFVTQKKYDYYDYAFHGIKEFDGKYVTRYAPGTAILSSPFYLVASIFDWGTVYDNYYKAFNGHSLADGLAILTSCVFYFILSVFFINKILKYFKLSRTVRIISIACAVISLYLYSYVFENVGYSHIFEVFTISGVMYFALAIVVAIEDKINVRIKNILGMGAFCGLVLLVRPTNLVIVTTIVIYAFWTLLRSTGLKKNIKSIVILLISSIPFALIYMIYNYQSYGGAFKNGYTTLVGQSINFKNFSLIEILFSDVRGLFVYSPLVLCVLVFMVWYLRKKIKRDQVILILLVPIVANILLYSSWPMWWAGDSVGNRFFINILPMLTVGIGLMVKRTKEKKRNVKLFSFFCLFILTIYSASICILSRFTPTDELYYKYNRQGKYSSVGPEGNYRAQDIFHYHYDVLMDSGDIGEYIEELKNGFRGGRSILLLLVGETDPIIKLESVSENEFRIHAIPNTTDKKINSEVVVWIESQERMFEYRIENFDFSQYKEFRISCDDGSCFADGIVTNETKSLPEQEYIELSNSINVCLDYKGDKVKFVDYKIKD
jgi:hypothetical protein